ncbi:alpha-L-fucosidase [Sphingobacterium suaedae]|uniref:alpha-L-fucosidase n=1 Tax=Sphingobacterium suaedae TaxID=1686402 RepID=A0ABW5KDR3_9SPHI
MKFNKKMIMALLLFSGASHVEAQSSKTQEQPKMEWFDDAKLGIFIHWGIYSVQGISESWAFFNNYISHENYLKQLGGFTAAAYQPKEWVKLIRESGAQYAVITSKHHDGVSLWDSKAPKALTTKKDAAAQRDVLSPFVKELKSAGLKTGIYFSLPDWSHPYYDVNTRLKKRYKLSDEPTRWNNYVGYYHQQLEELSTLYRPDLLWFDGDWEHSSEEWQAPKTLEILRRHNPDIIINSRLNHHGDYETPEQGVPVVRPESRYWELCYTMNDSWGFQPFDKHYKTPNMIVRTLIDCISMGGNLLLDIGPKADGTLPAEQLAILKELKRWTGKYSEAIYGTRAGVDSRFLREKNAFSKDGKTLFVYLDAKQQDLVLRGLQTEPTAIRLLASDGRLKFTYNEGEIHVELPADEFDPVASVVAVEFAEAPTFLLPTTAQPPVLSTLLKDKNDREVVRGIVEQTEAGANLFVGKLSEDGDLLNGAISFADDKIEAWVRKHAEVLSFANPGLPAGHYNGYSALSKDKQTLYLFVDGEPTGPIALKGLKNTIARIRIVGEGSMIGHEVFNKLYWSQIPGIVYINVPKERLDQHMTVVAVLLDKPIELYREQVGAIESNL